MQKESDNEKKLSETSDSCSDNAIKKYEYRGEFYGEFPYYIGIGEWSSTVTEEKVSEPAEFLDPVESAAVVSLLEDAIDELSIIKYLIGAPIVPWDLNYKTPTERYTRRLTPIKIFPEIDAKPMLTSEIKLQSERDSIEAIFTQTLNALMENRNFTPLSRAVERLRKEEQDDDSLVQELSNNLCYLQYLKVKVENKKKLDEVEEKERDEFLYRLQDELDDVKLKCNLEENFVQKWEDVRKAQNEWKLNIAENYFKENISAFLTKIKNEKRVTHEFQLFLRTSLTELEEQLDEWMTRYDSELERRENKIVQLKYAKDQAEEEKKRLKHLYEQQSAEMKEWVEFRDRRRRLAGASLVIQSWWRGMMVRKKLGPYKQQKQKNEKKEKK